MKFSIPKKAVNFTVSTLLQTFSGILISLLAVRIIGPEKLGLWQAALIIRPYVSFFQLGLTQGVGRELPFLMGQNKNEDVRMYASSAQFITSFYTVTCLLISLYFVIFEASNLEELLIYITAGIFISTMFIDNYLSATYRSAKSFKDLSKVYYLTTLIGVLLLPLLYFFEFKGYMCLLAIQSTSTSLLLIYYRPIKVTSKFLKSYYLKSIKIGFPIFFLTFLRNIPDTYPKIIILYFLSTTALGLTAPANAILTGFSVLPAAFAKYTYPQMTFTYGKTFDKEKLWTSNKKLILYITIFGLIGLTSLFFIPFLIETAFPKYLNSVSITMVAVGIGFLRMYSIIYNVFNILKSYREQSIVSISRNLFYLTFPILFYFIGPGQALTNIFYGILVAEFCSSGMLYYFVYKVTHQNNLSAI